MSHRTLPLYQVDAFTSEPFRGNPAAVCLLESPLPGETLRAIAAEMNLSETAFVHPLQQETWQDANTFALRWFTPQVEVRLCGHGTLATAAVLFREVGVATDTLHFETLSGTLTARRSETGIALNFPADPPHPYKSPDRIRDLLQDYEVEAVYYAPQTNNLLIHLESADDVQALEPDFARVLALTDQTEIHGAIVTARSEPPYDFISRYFAPWVGIEEDPVTGSAHTVLGPYWGQLLGRQEMLAYQASARGGELHVALLDGGRVSIGGKAVVVVRGELQLPE
ncbi:MAG: PhzF family phenazine biosynthesis protein [Anaerolineales bacterium]